MPPTQAERMLDVLSSLGVMVVVALALFLLQRFIVRSQGPAAQRRIGPQIVMLSGSVIAVIVVIVTLPLTADVRVQLFQLLGITITAVIALSSTSFVGNAMAGLMLRGVRNFRIGDFLEVGEHFGRVSERGLFHVEIQTKDRDLTTLPNLYLVSTPVTVTRSSGTVIWTDVSLGYDVKHEFAEEALLRGARASGLEDAYVHVLTLGDFSVLYRVAGFLEDVTRLLTSRSQLCTAVLDALHADGIEIVSPNFMNQRMLNPKTVIMPENAMPRWRAVGPRPATAESMAFDKAERAAEVESLEFEKRKLEQDLKDEDPYDPDDAVKRARLEEVEEALGETAEQKVDDEDD